MHELNPRLWSWATDLEPSTVEQAERTARLPIIHDHVALMADSHIGLGATVGSVLATKNAVIPAAVGVDIGCGMIATRLSAHADQRPDDLEKLLPAIGRVLPAGVGKGHTDSSSRARDWLSRHRPRTELSGKQETTAARQFGTLGSGNHFFEVCLDEADQVWIVLHSGSRGIGNQLAKIHIDSAKRMAKDLELALEDPDLAYFVQGTPEFEAYLADLLFAQEYAMANRQEMMDNAIEVILVELPAGTTVEDTVNCHHNFTALETHQGQELWITRKGAVRARREDRAVIPGSMGTETFITRGLGNPASWMSSSHGAGRRMSRAAARRAFSPTDLSEAMAGKTWLKDQAAALVDEIPSAYKDIRTVMDDQRDLVTIEHTLSQVLNYKGT